MTYIDTTGTVTLPYLFKDIFFFQKLVYVTAICKTIYA